MIINFQESQKHRPVFHIYFTGRTEDFCLPDWCCISNPVTHMHSTEVTSAPAAASNMYQVFRGIDFFFLRAAVLESQYRLEKLY